jgi:hypothetical protein
MRQSTLPSSDELIDSDDLPVDNEDQNFIPNVLLFRNRPITYRKIRDPEFGAGDS